MNLVRSGRKQPKLFRASAGVQARRHFATQRRAFAALLAAAGLAPAASGAADGMSIAGGPGEDAAMVEVSWFREFGFPDWSLGDWKLRSNLSLDAGYWHAYGRESSHDTKEVGATPIFRLEPPGAGPLYIEGGVGLHLISHTSINAERRLSTSLQFGDLVGFGWRLGERLQYEVGLRVVHFSNAGIKEPNSGINFVALQLAYRFATKAFP